MCCLLHVVLAVLTKLHACLDHAPSGRLTLSSHDKHANSRHCGNRAYKRLTEYELTEEQDLLRWKLHTSKQRGCDGNHCHPGQLGTYNLEHGGFNTHCACLAQNTECDASCQCKPPKQRGDPEACANMAVTLRHGLQLGSDVQEIDSWGLDCYTRKNIQDGESWHVSVSFHAALDCKHNVACCRPI